MVTLLTMAASAFCDSYVEYLNRGNAKYDKGDWDGAIADYNQAIELKPDYAAAFDNRGNAKRKKGDLDGAIADYTQAIVYEPDTEAASENGGNGDKEKDDRASSFSDFKKASAMELRPDAALPYKNRADVEYDKRDLDGALTDYNQAIVLKADFAEAYMGRGMAKRDIGDTEGAMVDCTKAIELNPKFAWAFHVRGCLRYDAHDFKEAAEDFRKEVELVSSSDYARFRIMLIRSRLGEAEAASTELRTYLSTRPPGKPDDWDCKIGLFLAGQLAESEFLAAAKKGPQKGEEGQLCQSYFYAGSKHLLAGDKATAMDDFQQAIATDERACFEYVSAASELKFLKAQKN
jgi:tetratricopeptide (TPR) repeat protein